MPLPLKLAPFERYMLTDDRPTHPMTFTIRLKFSGPFDRSAFESAVPRAVRRHPLLAAQVEGRNWRNLNWVPARNSLPYLHFADETTALRFPGAERIDLRLETGLRIWVRSGETRTEMRFQFHHSCCDGMGAARFIEDLLCAYHMAVRPGSDEAMFRPLNPALLETRTRFGLSWPGWLLRLPQETFGIVAGLLIFLLGRPVPLCSPQRPGRDESDPLTLLDYPAHTFDKAETKHLRNVAFGFGTFLNDLLLRDLVLAMHEWNSRHDEKSRRRGVRITIPVNLRSSEDDAMPAANVVAMVFIHRGPRWCRDPRRLLISIKARLQFFQRWRLGLAFVRSCAIIGALPGGMAFLTRANRCYTTSVLSNMGRVFAHARLPRREGKIVTGDLTLDAVESAPPVRPYSSASLTCLTYAGKWTLVMNYDRRHFTAKDAKALLATIVRQTRRAAGLSTDLSDAEAEKQRIPV